MSESKREYELRSQDARSTPEKNNSKQTGSTSQTSNVAIKVHKPKTNGRRKIRKPIKKNVKTNSARRDKGNKPKPLIPRKYKVGAAGLVGIAVVGTGAYVVSQNNTSKNAVGETNDATTNNDDGPSLGFSRHHKHSSSKGSHDKGNLSDLLNDASDSKSGSKSKKSNDDKNIDNILAGVTNGGAKGSTLKSLLKAADKSKLIAASLGGNDIKKGDKVNIKSLAASNDKPATVTNLANKPTTNNVQKPANTTVTPGSAASAGNKVTPVAPNNKVSPNGNANPGNNSTTVNPGGAKTPATPANPGNNSTAVTPVNPGSSATPANSSNPGSSSQPVTPNNPGNSSTPVTPNNPSSSSTPVTPDNPGSSSTPVTPDNPGSSSTPVTPDNPGSSSTPVTSDNPGSSSTPVTSDNPGSSATPGTSDNPSSSSTPVTPDNPGSSATPGTSDNPDSSSNPVVPDNPSSSATPSTSDNPSSSATSSTSDKSGSGSTPGISDNPGGSAATDNNTSVSTSASTGVQSDSSSNQVPIAENVYVTTPDGSSHRVNGIGIGFDQSGNYTVTAQVNLQGGSKLTINKTIAVTNGGTLSDTDSNTATTQTITASTINTHTGDNVPLFDSISANAENGRSLTGLDNGGGVSFNQAGTYQLSFTVGNVKVVRNIIVS